MNGRSIYFTEQEIKMIIKYVNEATNILGEAEDTCAEVDEDLENGLGSALRKLYKGRNWEKHYSEYKTRRVRVIVE